MTNRSEVATGARFNGNCQRAKGEVVKPLYLGAIWERLGLKRVEIGSLVFREFCPLNWGNSP